MRGGLGGYPCEWSVALVMVMSRMLGLCVPREAGHLYGVYL